MTYAIEVSDVTKTIDGKTILSHVDLRIPQGQIYGFMGANGAGKTSMMKALYHILVPDSGQIKLLGEVIKNGTNKVFSRVGSVIETPVFYDNFDGYKNLQLHCGYMGIDGSGIGEILSLFDLTDAAEKKVKHYSLGMKQRLALARAFLAKPDLLILDEPINGLDPQGINQIRVLLENLNYQYDTTIFISSHILSELSKIADTIGIIDSGSMLAEVSMDEIRSKNIDLEAYYLRLIRGVA